MEENRERKDLKIPENVSDRDEIIAGIGKSELIIILIMFLVSIVTVVIVFFVSQSLPIGFFVGIGEMAVTIVLVIRDRIGENMIDKFKIVIWYTKMQKKYQYRHYDVYEELMGELTDESEYRHDS